MKKIGNQTTEKLLDILQFQVTFLFSILFASLFITFVACPVQVNGSSMDPTLHDRDFGISNILFKNIEGIDRFDIVIVKVNNEYWVKRVIGLPNDTISCESNQVYVNGEPINEYYLDDEYILNEIKDHGVFNSDFNEIVINDDELFLMGDNRVHSLDSRHVGPFKLSAIKSKDILIFWPLSHGGVVK